MFSGPNNYFFKTQFINCLNKFKLVHFLMESISKREKANHGNIKLKLLPGKKTGKKPGPVHGSVMT